MRRWLPYAFGLVVVAAAWWFWRRRGLDVHATVTIPEDEIVVKQDRRSIFSVQPGESAMQRLIRESNEAIAAHDGEDGMID